VARIAIAGFIHETNTFAPMLTPLSEFGFGNNSGRLITGDKILELRGKKFNNAVCGFIDTAEKMGHEMIPLLVCSAEPAAQVTENAFETVMSLIGADLFKNQPYDAIFLDLHGAMVYEPFNDGETEIVRRVKAIVGDIPIVTSLDLHGNITPECFRLTSGMVGYRTYPHVDLYETGERCAVLLDRMISGQVVYKAFRQLPFLMPISAQSTNTEPSKSIYAKIAELEQDNSLFSASIMLGFPPADIYDTGTSIFTYAVTQALADKAADALYDLIMFFEDRFVTNLLSPEDAVRKALLLSKSEAKPVVLSDVQDNSGGGATSDTTWILSALVEQNAQGAALGLMYDPDAAEAAHAAGEGAQIHLKLGGKLMPGHTPFVGEFTVEKLHAGPFIGYGPMIKGDTVDLGKMAHLSIGGVHVAVSSGRVQMLDQSFFKIVGIEPTEMKIIVVKSANHYRADFQPISSHIISVEAPGAIIEDPSKANYVNLREGIRLYGKGPALKK